MHALIDNHVKERLQKLLINGEPITVYEYGPDREKGESVYPSISFQRLYDRIDARRIRDGHEFFTSSTEETTLEFTAVEAMGGDVEITGPVSWTVKPFPTPVYFVYELDLRATERAHIEWMEASLYQAFPPGYSLFINDQAPLFILGDAENLDERENSLFRRIVPLTVQDLYIERLESLTVQSITEPHIEVEVDGG